VPRAVPRLCQIATSGLVAGHGLDGARGRPVPDGHEVPTLLSCLVPVLALVAAHESRRRIVLPPCPVRTSLLPSENSKGSSLVLAASGTSSGLSPMSSRIARPLGPEVWPIGLAGRSPSHRTGRRRRRPRSWPVKWIGTAGTRGFDEKSTCSSRPSPRHTGRSSSRSYRVLRASGDGETRRFLKAWTGGRRVSLSPSRRERDTVERKEPPHGNSSFIPGARTGLSR